MRKLNKLQTYIYLMGAVLMAMGAGCCAFLFYPKVFAWVYLAGAVAFVAMQVEQRYDGQSFVIRRLRRIMLLSGLFFILAGLSLLDTQYGFLKPYMALDTYYTYFYNKWVVLILAGALMQLYTTHRISNELQKD